MAQWLNGSIAQLLNCSIAQLLNRMSSNFPKVVATLGVVVIGLTGCNSTNGAGVSGGAPTPEPTRLMPLDEYLSPIWTTSMAEAQQLEQELERNTQELIAQCMHEAGFDYVPFVPEPEPIVEVEEERPDDLDWVTQWGYGLLWSPGGSIQAVPIGGIGEDNPNYELLNSLSEAERAAYQIALDGPPLSPVADGESGEMVTIVLERGCRGWARMEANSRTPSGVWNSDEFAPLREAVTSMSQADWVLNELAIINADWATCMADAGYLGLERQQDAKWVIYDEMSATMLQVVQNGGDFATAPELAEYREREIEMALADLQCRERVNYRERTSDVAFEMQTQFVNDHRSELEAFRAAIEQQ